MERIVFGPMVVLMIGCFVYPIIHWFMYPEMSQMQIAIELWPFYAIGFVLLAVLNRFLNK